jgi:hypothetical protein
MIGKLSVLGFTLVTALSGSALAHEPYDTSRGPSHGHPGPGGHGRPGPANYGGGYRPAPPAVTHASRVEVDLRYADLNRDGWVTMQEALDSSRQVFRRNDRNNDRVLSRWEAGGTRVVRHGDRNQDGRVTMNEYQRNVRARFASLDTNRDGFLARHELGLEPQRGSRSAGWWRNR